MFAIPALPRRYAALSIAAASLCSSAAFAQVPSARNGLTPQALFERTSPHVWVLQANDAQGKSVGTGSAVALGPGAALTSCRLLAKASQLSLRRDNVSYGATLEFPDVERDLCQLRVPNLPAASLALVPAADLAVGMPLYSIGAPRGQEMALGIAMLAAVRRSSQGSVDALQLASAPEGLAARACSMRKAGSPASSAQRPPAAPSRTWRCRLRGSRSFRRAAVQPSRHSRCNRACL
ncbi:serine protease [Variovorax sp. OV329]|uniref:S1 family peptidase n=1 Tax=Variovorax sp. OV329 TaxID=1882825 RepID=UPI0011137B3A|nr:serine protease [Variovorax sp. OV329]